MTSPALAPQTIDAPVGHRTRAVDLLRSEWTKLRSVRSTRWSLLIAALTAIGASAVVAFASRTAPPPSDPLASIFLGWLEYPLLAVGILGVLAFTSEHATGQIRTTFTTVPQRRTVVAAKAAVVGGLILVFGEAMAAASFAATELVLTGTDNRIDSSASVVALKLAAAGLVLAGVALVGLAMGVILRNTAAAIAALPAVLYLPLVTLSLPSPWNHRLGQFSLLGSAYQLVSDHPNRNLLSPGPAVVVVLAWPAAALTIAAVLVCQRDV